MKKLEGKVALIAAGNGGIGQIEISRSRLRLSCCRYAALFFAVLPVIADPVSYVVLNRSDTNSLVRVSADGNRSQLSPMEPVATG